jgi:hypothetical protein
MSRRWLGLALLLSVGVNLGVAVVLGTIYWTHHREHAARTAPDERPARPGGLGGEPEPEEFRRVAGPVQERVERLADGVGLEGEARERFVALQREFLETTWTGRRRVAELQHQLREELAAPTPDRARVESLVDELARVRRTLDESLATTVLESRALLAVESPGSEARYLEFLERLGPGSRGGARGRLRGHVPRRPLRP